MSEDDTRHRMATSSGQAALIMASSNNKSLRKSQSMPHLLSRNDSGVGYSGAGSCNVLDQMFCTVPMYPIHQRINPDDKISYANRLVTDFRQLLTLRQHYYPEGGWGWILVIIAFIIQVLAHGLLMAFGVLAVKMVDVFQRQYLYAGSLGAISMAAGLFISPVTISVCKRKSTRLIAVIGGLVTALGCLFTSFAVQYHQMLFSFGIIVGCGVGITRDCSTLMVAQYFKKRRDLVEAIIVSGSGCGIIFMSIFYHRSLSNFGWRFGLQTITATVFLTFILGLFYRSASLYHPQRRAILHLKNQRRKVKDKNKSLNSPPFFDFKLLRSKTVRIILTSSAVTACGIYFPIFYLAENIHRNGFNDKLVTLQIYMGFGWMLGCTLFGVIVAQNSVDCRIAKQYLCQAAIFLCGLCMIAFSGMDTTLEGHVMFVWAYGFFCGGYNYALKVYTYERVRARNFAYVWSCVQFAQAIPIAFGVIIFGYFNEVFSPTTTYWLCFLCTTIGSLILFCVDIHKRNVERAKKVSRKSGAHSCATTDDCSTTKQVRKLSFTQEPEHEPAFNMTGVTVNHFTEMLGQQLSDDIVESLNAVVVAIDKPELTCISEEGIADMDLPDNLFDDFDYIGDCITSCNKVENYLMLSEFENNLNVNPVTNVNNVKNKK